MDASGDPWLADLRLLWSDTPDDPWFERWRASVAHTEAASNPRRTLRFRATDICFAAIGDVTGAV